MTLKLGRYFGCYWRIGRDAAGVRWVYGVLWYPVRRQRVSYLYPSFRWF